MFKIAQPVLFVDKSKAKIFDIDFPPLLKYIKNFKKSQEKKTSILLVFLFYNNDIVQLLSSSEKSIFQPFSFAFSTISSGTAGIPLGI